MSKHFFVILDERLKIEEDLRKVSNKVSKSFTQITKHVNINKYLQGPCQAAC